MYISNNVHRVVIYYVHKYDKLLLVKLFLVYIMELHTDFLEILF